MSNEYDIMDSSDREHLNKVLEQLQFFLLNGLIALDKDNHFSSEFITKMSGVLSRVMEELSRISSGLKEKISFISWEFVEKMRNPEEIRKEFLMNPVRIRMHLMEEIPQLLDKIKNFMNDEP